MYQVLLLLFINYFCNAAQFLKQYHLEHFILFTKTNPQLKQMEEENRSSKISVKGILNSYLKKTGQF